MIILVCGGRDYVDKEQVHLALMAYLHDDPFIIQGGAKGADLLGKQWAEKIGVPVATVTANWERYNKAAGHIRNSWMLKLGPDLVIAFRGGKGTQSMCKLAEKAGVPVERVGWDG